MRAIFVGPDDGLIAAFESERVETTRIEGHGTGASLEEAGVGEADLLVLTDVDEATAVPVAKEANPDLRVVIYAGDTMPEFVRGQVDLAIAPDLLAPEVVAEELSGNGA